MKFAGASVREDAEVDPAAARVTQKPDGLVGVERNSAVACEIVAASEGNRSKSGRAATGPESVDGLMQGAVSACDEQMPAWVGYSPLAGDGLGVTRAPRLADAERG